MCFKARHEDFIMHSLSYFFRVRAFKKKLHGFFQVGSCLFHRGALARNIQLGGIR